MLSMSTVISKHTGTSNVPIGTATSIIFISTIGFNCVVVTSDDSAVQDVATCENIIVAYDGNRRVRRSWVQVLQQIN